MAVEIFWLIECEIEYLNGDTEVRRASIHEIATSFDNYSSITALDYFKNELPDVKKVSIKNVYYFKSEEEYNKYLKTITN